MAPSSTSHLSPDDAAVAVRSFPRRFRAVLARPEDEDDRVDPDELARRTGPDGRSAADHLVAANGVLSLVARALAQVQGGSDPALHPALADLGSAWWEDPRTPLGSILDELDGTATESADRIDAVPTDDWGRQVRVGDGGGTRQLLDVVRDAVAVTADHLRAAERTIQAVR